MALISGDLASATLNNAVLLRVEQLAAAVGLDVKSADGFTRSGGQPLGTEASIIDAVFDEVVLSGSQLSERSELFGPPSHLPGLL